MPSACKPRLTPERSETSKPCWRKSMPPVVVSIDRVTATSGFVTAQRRFEFDSASQTPRSASKRGRRIAWRSRRSCTPFWSHRHPRKRVTSVVLATSASEWHNTPPPGSSLMATPHPISPNGPLNEASPTSGFACWRRVRRIRSRFGCWSRLALQPLGKLGTRRPDGNRGLRDLHRKRIAPSRRLIGTIKGSGRSPSRSCSSRDRAAGNT